MYTRALRNFNADWTVVRAHLGSMDICRNNSICDIFAGKPVIDPPADVSCTSICPMRPPDIMAVSFGRKFTECINEACINKFLKSSAFFIGKSRIADIFLSPRQVNLNRSTQTIQPSPIRIPSPSYRPTAPYPLMRHRLPIPKRGALSRNWLCSTP